MCASYHINTDAASLQKHINVLLPESFQFSKFVLPHSQAPVILKQENDIVLKLMKFSLLPSWSKEPKVKFATHNARIETIDSKPTWKVPFQKRHCLIPISSFVEPIYLNELAGNMVNFSQQDDNLMLAAGIWDTWTNKESGEVIDSFSIITKEPPKFIEETGHDRCPLFLSGDSLQSWLNSENEELPKLKELLLTSSADIAYKATIERPLKEGWQKRIPKD